MIPVLHIIFRHILDDDSPKLSPARSAMEQQRALELIQGLTMLSPAASESFVRNNHMQVIIFLRLSVAD